MTLLKPTAQLIAQAWLAGLPQLAGIPIDDVLPPVADWGGAVFVQTTTIGGGADPYVPVRRPVIQVDVWAPTGGATNRPQWNLANAYADEIYYATFGPHGYGTLSMRVSGFDVARVAQVEPQGEPKPEAVDPTGLARFRLDLLFTYTLPSLTIP